MEDFAKKLIVLVLLLAFFGALFLEFPIFYKKIQNGEIPSLDFLNLPKSDQKQNDFQKTYDGEIKNYSSKNNSDHSQSSRICVPALDPAPFADCEALKFDNDYARNYYKIYKQSN